MDEDPAIVESTILTGGNDENDANAPTFTVKRNTGGNETTITLTHTEQPEVKYTKVVDSGYEIDGWSDQTLTRSDETDLPTPQEATVLHEY